MSDKPDLAKSPARKDIDLDKMYALANDFDSKKSKDSEKPKVLPWENLSNEVIKLFNLRLSQVQTAQLKYIVKNSLEFDSIHQICISAVEKEIKRLLKNIV